MRIPTPLLFGAVPIAIVLVVAGVAIGPLFLADANFIVGIPLTIAGFALAYVVARSLHSLSTRWLVVVPAGLALVDPLTLLDPVLVRREVIEGIRRVPGPALPPGALDLRLGTLGGGLEIDLGDEVMFGHRRGRIDGNIVQPTSVAVAVVRTDAVIALAESRRIRVR